MTWFSELFGFSESEAGVRSNIVIDGASVHSAANSRSFAHGTLEIPTLGELRTQAGQVASSVKGTLQIRQVVANAQELHRDPANAGSLFQVASQFNLLEMVSPDVTPDQGITRYESDRTQGPACAMACAAGTLYRNWFAQTTKHQIDTLAEVGASLGNDADRYWQMRNGYALLTGDCPTDTPTDHDELRIGVHYDTEVTLEGADHLVSQAYCSALPIAYSPVSADEVEPLARLVLNSSYEATFAAGAVNAERTGNNSVFLTLIGGGVFGNPSAWIIDAIERAATIYAHTELDVAIVSFGNSNPELQRMLG